MVRLLMLASVFACVILPPASGVRRRERGVFARACYLGRLRKQAIASVQGRQRFLQRPLHFRSQASSRRNLNRDVTLDQRVHFVFEPLAMPRKGVRPTRAWMSHTPGRATRLWLTLSPKSLCRTAESD